MIFVCSNFGPYNLIFYPDIQPCGLLKPRYILYQWHFAFPIKTGANCALKTPDAAGMC